jgi:hypothetical protein
MAINDDLPYPHLICCKRGKEDGMICRLKTTALSKTSNRYKYCMRLANPIMAAARKKATEQGLVRYDPHVPCVNGHHSERYTKHNTCIQCLTEWRAKNKDSLTKLSTNWQKRNRAHMREYHRKWRERNAERWKELNQQGWLRRKAKRKQGQNSTQANK